MKDRRIPAPMKPVDERRVTGIRRNDAGGCKDRDAIYTRMREKRDTAEWEQQSDVDPQPRHGVKRQKEKFSKSVKRI